MVTRGLRAYSYKAKTLGLYSYRRNLIWAIKPPLATYVRATLLC